MANVEQISVLGIAAAASPGGRCRRADKISRITLMHFPEHGRLDRVLGVALASGVTSC
jgi:hypothetical protein